MPPPSDSPPAGVMTFCRVPNVHSGAPYLRVPSVPLEPAPRGPDAG